MESARAYAWKALNRIILEHGYASLILRGMEGYSREDRSLISEIVYGTLRNYTRLSYQWEDLASHVKRKTAVLLNMSVYQLFFLDRIPDYAVINEACSLVSEKEKGFVNAVLHKVQKRGMIAPEFHDELERMAFETSHPLWLLKLWSAHYGMENAVKIAEADQQRPIVYGRRNPLKISREELFSDRKVHFLEADCFTYDGILTETSWFDEGKVLIQDRASQAVGRLLEAEPGMCVLDACAAPGTKTQEIASEMKNQGMITALDLHEERVKLIEQLMVKTGVSIVSCRAADASKPIMGMEPESMDRILVDAPCSGLGDLSHKPEIRMHVTPESLDELTKLQASILENAAAYLKKGGSMLYSTCTLNRKENENQVNTFLKRHPEFERISEKTWFPYELESDGFYAAVLTKTGSAMVK